MLKSKEVKNTAERLMCTGMIVSDHVLKTLSPILNLDVFTAKYTKLISTWCLDYFNEYGEAPKMHIKNVYESKKRDELDEDTAELIERLLQNLSEDFVKDTNFNEGYVITEAEKYIKARSATILCEDVQALISNGRITEAEGKISSYIMPKKAIASGASIFEKEFWNKEAQENKKLFKLPKDLNNFVGPIERDSFIGILAGEKIGKCVVGSSLCLLPDGSYKTVEQIIADKDAYAVSYNETTRKFIPNKVLDWWDNGVKDVVDVSYRSGKQISITLNHPLLTPEGWKNVGELSVGSYVANPKRVALGLQTDKMESWEAILLGLWIADGGTTRINSLTYTKKEQKLIDLFYELTHKLGDTCYTSKKGIEHIIRNATKSKTAIFLQKYGLVGCKSINKKIPHDIFQSSEALIATFLGSLFSGDGWVTSHEIGIAFSNEFMLRQVSSLLLRLGILGKVRSKAKGAWEWCVKDCHNKILFAEKIQMLGIKQEKLQLFLTTWKETKQKSFLEKIPATLASYLIKEIEKEATEKGYQVSDYVKDRQKWYSLKKETGNGNATMLCSWTFLKHSSVVSTIVFDSDIYWDEIVCISETRKEHTYDLTMDTHHSFIINDCLVHNTWFLMYLGLQALRQSCNVAFFSVGDMTESQMQARLEHMLSFRDPKKLRETVLFPVIDCLHNQQGACPIGNGVDPCYFEEGEGKKTTRTKGTHKDFPKHRTCTLCKGDIKNERYFMGASWLEERETKDIFTPLEESVNSLKRRSKGKDFKLFCYPAYQCNIATIEAELDILEQQEGFVPDVIIVDYADILAPEPFSLRKEYRHQINDSWIALRALSQKKNCAVISATQAKLEVRKKAQVEQTDITEDKRKLGHVTHLWSLSQTPTDKRDSKIKMGVLLARDQEFDPDATVEILQCLSLGKPCVACYQHKTYVPTVRKL